jgi:hypothetical protein
MTIRLLQFRQGNLEIRPNALHALVFLAVTKYRRWLVGARKKSQVQFRFETRLIEWRGPAPFVYAPVPAEHVEELRRVAKVVSYGWGCVPVEAKIGSTTFTTSLFPKDDTYLLPLKIAVRRKTNVTVGDKVSVVMTLGAVRV